MLESELKWKLKWRFSFLYDDYVDPIEHVFFLAWGSKQSFKTLNNCQNNYSQLDFFQDILEDNYS